VLILLPPSEGKAAPAAGDPVDPAALVLPALAPARRRVLRALTAMCGRTSTRSVTASMTALGLTAGQREEIGRNAGLLTAPAGPAAGVYRGVLYEALDAATLPPAARAWLDERVLVFSALWGVVRLTDRIPAYRCAAGVTLPGLGGLTPYWRKALTPALARLAGNGLVLDLRSGAYAAMWTPAGNVASVRVLHERTVAGVATRTVVSHFNKATKGRIVRALAEAGARPSSAGELAAVLRDLKYTVEERGSQLDVVVAEL
jgi:cytoplasmic iron level regulating protein YaaA (DUF328/UPF0246 family)